MEDRDKTKDELIQELVLLRQKLTKMETDQDPLSVSDDVVRQEDEIYRSFYENLPLGYQSLDENGCFLEVNQAWLNTMGYSREDVIGKWFGDFITLGYQETFRANFLKFKAAGEIRRAELEILKKDQSTIFAVFEGKISRHLDGRFKQTHCVLLDITQAKRVEDALRYSEALKQAILDGITTNIAFVNEDLEILWANKTAAGSVGKSLSEMLGHTCHSLWADNAKPCPDCPTVEAFKTKKSYHTTIATPDGRIWDEKGEPVFDAQGNLLGVVEIAHDITERKRAEEALRESEAKFRLITEAMVDIVWTMDLNLQTTYVSPSIERLLGFTQEERLRQSIEEQVTPESLLKIRDTLTEELAKEQHGTTDPDRYITIVVEQYKKDGSTVWLENMVRAIRDPQGMIIGLHGLSRDVTERKRAEEALRQSHRRLEESQRIGKIGTFEWNAVTGETCWSDEVYRIFGLEPGSVVPSYELAKEHTFPADTDLWQQTVSESLASKKKFQLQCRFLRKDGTIIWIDNQGDIIWDADGTATGIFGTIQDITQRKNLEVELLQSQKMQAIGTLAAGIAHDFNNMLQVILGYTDLLLLGKKEGQPGYKELKKIIKTSRDARNLVQKIRIFSRKADIQPVPLDLNHEVEEVAKILSHTMPKTIDLNIHLAQDLVMINADPGLMNQMVMNLGINAGEAMP
ncbi:MAG: hypothetical protein QG577_2004, partial [Thermodesulfobacteriota bacterium]|nr:hypothetical protein [Thermodesulfobacteriota bacterium]